MAAHFDLSDLKLLVHISETKSLTGASDKSCLSLPAASMRLKKFEENLSTKLFYRSGKGLSLTPAGDVVLRCARDVDLRIERMHGELHKYTRGLKGTLRLQANTTATTDLLPAVLPAFLATHPDVDIDLCERLSVDIVRAVAEGSTDLGIVAGEINAEGVEIIPYRDDKLVLVTAPTHELSGRTEISFVETLNYDHVCLQDRSAISVFLSQIANINQRQMRTRIRVGNFDAACRIIEANVAVGIVPASCAQRFAQSMNIQIIPLTDTWSIRKLSICVKSIDQLPPFGRDLIDVLLDDMDNPTDESLEHSAFKNF